LPAGNTSSISSTATSPPRNSGLRWLRLPTSTAELFHRPGRALLWSSGTGARRTMRLGMQK
jgi:hypothetical protein